MQIIKLTERQQYKIIDDEFNQKVFPKLIGQITTFPPAFAHVELVKKERLSFEDIYKQALKSTKPIKKFVSLCLKDNYLEKEIIQKIGELYNKNTEESMDAFREVILEMVRIKGDQDETR